MCGTYPPSDAASRLLGLSYPLSKFRFCSTSSGSGRSTTIASIVSFRSFCSTTFAPAIATPNGPPSPSVSRLFFVPFLPRSVGFLPVFFPPEPGLAQHRVRTLPLPLHPAEFVALGDQHRPDPLDDTPLDPALEPVVGRALGAEPLGELVPLAAAPHPEDDRVEHLPPVGDLASGRLLGPGLEEDGLDPLPERVGDLPERWEGVDLRLRFGLPLPLGRGGGHRVDPPEYAYIPL